MCPFLRVVVSKPKRCLVQIIQLKQIVKQKNWVWPNNLESQWFEKWIMETVCVSWFSIVCRHVVLPWFQIIFVVLWSSWFTLTFILILIDSNHVFVSAGASCKLKTVFRIFKSDTKRKSWAESCISFVVFFSQIDASWLFVSYGTPTLYLFWEQARWQNFKE